MNDIKEIIAYIRSSQWLLALVGTVMIPLTIIVLGRIVDIILEGSRYVLVIFFGNKTADIIMNYMMFIGVIHHEIAHTVVAFLTGCKIGKINLYRPNKRNGTLGSVEYYNTGNVVMQGIQNTLTPIAPVILGILSICLLNKYVIDIRPENWYKTIIIYIEVCIFLHMQLSRADIKIFIKGMIIMIPILYVVLYFTKYDIFTILNYIQNLKI